MTQEPAISGPSPHRKEPALALGHIAPLGQLKFLEAHNLPRMGKEEIENMNRLNTSNKTESVILKLLINKNSGSVGFIGEFYQTFREELTPNLLKFFQKKKKKYCKGRNTSKLVFKASIILIPKPDKNITKKKITNQYY